MELMKEDKHLYPTLPFDTKQILTLRHKCQKTRRHEEILSWFVLRRFSIYVTYLLAKTRITPNHISWSSVVLFMITGILVAIAKPWSMLLAVTTYYLAYLCDCIDGELARLKAVTSPRGVFLDTLIRAMSIPVVTAIGLALLVQCPFLSLHVLESIIIYVIAVSATLALLVPLSYHFSVGDAGQEDPVSQMRTNPTRNEWIAFLTGLPGLFTLLPVAILLQYLTGLAIITVFLVGFLFLFSVKTLIRLYITYQNI
ncbi:CDP-alcohol phosphatidyltransferase [Caldalkalibacillus thermarum TA2.A1]|uniref:CDP-alcohol phosphatidyltransferase n=1 Tax=Caldalkalibacillus thermarum (strain TA2.A1) TaxID=986075 RepID=F5L990_CALTT|nr:CDP-alcohol phosphatidyltransferase family protein [Caldalkalibacillus thermarum]EGL82032.1 CDP-alcohol phosphatidyltransferase [Caldalkalibacillus thermarum TA2.A1]QZT34049.1 CDP-alcohol phosphatidyltransferase family protein [Caldalkalibacillus thermarum TA2.A1]